MNVLSKSHQGKEQGEEKSRNNTQEIVGKYTFKRKTCKDKTKEIF